MKRHDLSSMFPEMLADDFAKLVADIKTNGLLDPIITWRGEIVDGWHRYKACGEASVDPRFVEFDGDDHKALAMVVSRNARRRHLTEAAIVGITKRVLGWHEAAAGRGGNRRIKGAVAPLVTHEAVAAIAGVSRDTVKRHTAIEKKSPALLQMVERGDIGLASAARIVETGEVLAAPTKAEIAALAHALSERPQARCSALLKAARDFRDQWQSLLLTSQTDEIASAMHEAMFLIRQCRARGER
jgi:ParB-like chromosome segregation protein Spo0J